MDATAAVEEEEVAQSGDRRPTAPRAAGVGMTTISIRTSLVSKDVPRERECQKDGMRRKDVAELPVGGGEHGPVVVALGCGENFPDFQTFFCVSKG